MTGIETVSTVLIAGGVLLGVVSAVGLNRFEGVLMRTHAASKPQVVGLILVLIGTIIRVYGDPNVWMLVLVGLFTLLTAPVIAHLLGRTAYREQRHRDGLLAVNELGDEMERRSR